MDMSCLMIDGKWPRSQGWVVSTLGRCKRKQAKHGMKNKPVSSVPVYSLGFSSCLGFPWRWTVICKSKKKKPFLCKFLCSVFYYSNRKQTRSAGQSIPRVSLIMMNFPPCLWKVLSESHAKEGQDYLLSWGLPAAASLWVPFTIWGPAISPLVSGWGWS